MEECVPKWRFKGRIAAVRGEETWRTSEVVPGGASAGAASPARATGVPQTDEQAGSRRVPRGELTGTPNPLEGGQWGRSGAGSWGETLAQLPPQQASLPHGGKCWPRTCHRGRGPNRWRVPARKEQALRRTDHQPRIGGRTQQQRGNQQQANRTENLFSQSDIHSQNNPFPIKYTGWHSNTYIF